MGVVEKPNHSKADMGKWLLILLLLVGGVVANVYYSHIVWSIRLAVGILLACVVIAIALQTNKGRRAWAFAKESRGELRKVVWPTRQETIQTALVVIVIVVAMSIILWGLDSVFMWAVSFLSGQRGA